MASPGKQVEPAASASGPAGSASGVTQPTLKVDFVFEIGDQDAGELAAIFQCNLDELSAKLKPYALAALQEYVEMFLGREPMSRTSDVKEFRLYTMMLKAFGGGIPDEELTGSLFQLNQLQVRALIKSVLRRYQHRLRKETDIALKGAFESIPGKWDEKEAEKEVEFKSKALLDGLNQIIARKSGSAVLIRLKPGTAHTYVIKPSGYKTLKEYFEGKNSRQQR